MGTYFTTGASKKDVIAELTNNENAIARCIRGNILWAVMKNAIGTRFIMCFKLVVHEGEWGYKPIDEEMHPFYFNCPLKYLDEVPEQCPEWRAQVRAYHAKNKEEREGYKRLGLVKRGRYLYKVRSK